MDVIDRSKPEEVSLEDVAAAKRFLALTANTDDETAINEIDKGEYQSIERGLPYAMALREDTEFWPGEEVVSEEVLFESGSDLITESGKDHLEGVLLYPDEEEFKYESDTNPEAAQEDLRFLVDERSRTESKGFDKLYSLQNEVDLLFPQGLSAKDTMRLCETTLTACRVPENYIAGVMLAVLIDPSNLHRSSVDNSTRTVNRAYDASSVLTAVETIAKKYHGRSWTRAESDYAFALEELKDRELLVDGTLEGAALAIHAGLFKDSTKDMFRTQEESPLTQAFAMEQLLLEVQGITPIEEVNTTTGEIVSTHQLMLYNPIA